MAAGDIIVRVRNGVDNGPAEDLIIPRGVDPTTGPLVGQTKFCTTEFVAVTGTTGATLTNIVGLTGFELVAAGVYLFEIWLNGVTTTNAGHKLGFKYTTATLTSLNAIVTAHAAASTATVQASTATDQASLIASKAAAWLGFRITGRIIVNAAGTLALQCAQETAHADETKIYVGSSMRLQRVS